MVVTGVPPSPLQRTRAVHFRHVTVLLLTTTLPRTEDVSQEQPVGLRNLFCFLGFILDS